MQDHSSMSVTSTSENNSDITMLPELPPGSNERLRAPLEFPDDVELDDIEVILTDSIVPPNEQAPRHYHPGQDFLYVVEGSAEHIVDGEPYEIIEAGDAREIPYEAEHEPRATEEGARVITFRVNEKGEPERFLEEDHEHGEELAGEDHSSTSSSTSTNENTSDIAMLPELPPGSNEILRSSLESPEDIDDIEVIISDVIIPPNEGLPRHYHPGEEFLYILEGSTVHDVDGEPYEIIEAGDGRVIPYERRHEPRATEEGARVVVFRVHEEGEPERFLVEDHEHGDELAGTADEETDTTNLAVLDEEFDRSFPPPGWTTFIGENGIGEAENWTLRFPLTAVVEPEDVSGGLAADWLVTPSLKPSAENNTLRVNAQQGSEEDRGSIYTIRVSTESQDDPDDFEIIKTYSEADLGTEDSTTITADLSAYQGQDIYVALVMENDNGDELILDQVGGIPLTPDILVSQYGQDAVLSRGGTNETLQVELTSQPVSPVTLSFSTDTEEILPTDSVTFTPENWKETQNVNLELAQIGSTGGTETNFDLNVAVETTDPVYSEISPSAIEGTIVDSGIPEFPSYRTVEETYDDLADLAETNSEIANWVDIGDSYDKITPDGPEGDDIYALELTNKNSEIEDEDKPTLYVEGAIHAREYATSELVTRFAEELVEGYGENADTTWILDNFKVAVVPIVNPDGRNLAEEGYLWRKNTNPNPPTGEEPAPFPDYGIDLNRNFSQKWGEIPGGSSNDPNNFDYRGTEPFSEPETQAVRDYVTSLFPDQKEPGDFEAAPDDTTGVFLDVHSFGNLALYPFSWTDLPAGNKKGLETLGRKFGYFTGVDGEAYNVTPWITGLYATDGDSMAWAYDEFGIASYTVELGTKFFQDTEYFEETIIPEMMPALMYAAKTAYRPYQQPAGPETIEVSTDLTQVVAGTEVVLSATADDTRYNDGEGDRLDSEDEPVQDIAQARYTIDTPPWLEEAEFFDLKSADGELDSSVEELTAKIDTSKLSPGRHTIFIESQDANGNFGVPSAVFVNVLDFSPEVTILDGSDEAETLVGTGESEVIYGRRGEDTVAGGLGDDLLFGNGGADVLRGDRASVFPSGEGGDDWLYGGNGNDTLDGKGGDDTLYGENGDDYLLGLGGNDTLSGGAGDDTLVGDDFFTTGGSDTFVLTKGTDVIVDFVVDEDVIVLPEAISYGQLSISQDRQDTLIDYETTTLAVLRDVEATTVGEKVFL